MQKLNLKSSHKTITDYYKSLEGLESINVSNETSIRQTFQGLLQHCAKQFKWTLVPEWKIKREGKSPISVDGALVDTYKLTHGYWEAKDEHDDLNKEIKRKLALGYPRNNILFQSPKRAVLYQDNNLLLDADITNPAKLIEILKLFFEYRPPEIAEWEEAAEEFQKRVPELAHVLIDIIRKERDTNKQFMLAFDTFYETCKESLNPNLSENAVEEMLIQHLLTERIFSKVFDNPDFIQKNVIAKDIEKVINALASKSFSKNEFLKNLNRFYVALETAATTIDDYSQKQHFLNTVYEKFFQGFSVKVADTHGIVYTPQPVVNFMVKSVNEILKQEFGKSLSDKGVQILDPFTGTGNFIVRTMQEIKKTSLKYKYQHELHADELILLPYYIASMNIEHQYYSLTGTYEPFEGICLVDTFDLAESSQYKLFTAENTHRVEMQKQSAIFVVIANPPYNSKQANENDNNKNRKYPIIDRRVNETYAKDSKASNKSALSDPYVKAIRWATDRIGDEGIVCFVSNNSFINDIAFDGMRKNLAKDFNKIYVLDLKGNIRKDSMRDGIPLGEKNTVFGLAAMVGISINIFIKHKSIKDNKIYYSAVDFRSTREEKFRILDNAVNITKIKWTEIAPDKNNNWLNEGTDNDFGSFVSIGDKEDKSSDDLNPHTIFKTYSRGVATARDTWAYNFSKQNLEENIKATIEEYNFHVFKFHKTDNVNKKIDDFVNYDDSKISWSRDLKLDLQRNRIAEFKNEKIRRSLYRPFCKEYLFFDRILNEEVYVFPSIMPDIKAESENKVIIVPSPGSNQVVFFITDVIVDLNFFAGSTPNQCFPFYTYQEDGTNRRENITDWSLQKFKTTYKDKKITKWDIFYYIYGVLHHPEYKTKYAANLRRELPHIPYTMDFWSFSKAGKQLADLHVNYENAKEFPLDKVETTGQKLNWEVEKMRLSKDKTTIIYNDFLSLTGIPPETFEYKLGNRSALDWIIEQYHIKTDKRSGITNNPNRPDEPDYIVKLICKIVTVSLKTVKIISNLPPLMI
jgi:predicted helicase